MDPLILFNYFPLKTMHASWFEELAIGHNLLRVKDSHHDEVRWQANRWLIQKYDSIKFLDFDFEGLEVKVSAMKMLMQSGDELAKYLRLLGLASTWQDVKKILNGKKLNELRSLFGGQVFSKVMNMAPLLTRDKKAFVETFTPSELSVPLTECKSSNLSQWFEVRGLIVLSCALGRLTNSYCLRLSWKNDWNYQQSIKDSWQQAKDESDYHWSNQLVTKISKVIGS